MIDLALPIDPPIAETFSFRLQNLKSISSYSLISCEFNLPFAGMNLDLASVACRDVPCAAASLSHPVSDDPSPPLPRTFPVA